MGSIWGRQGPDGPHVGPMNFAIWVSIATLALRQPYDSPVTRKKPCTKWIDESQTQGQHTSNNAKKSKTFHMSYDHMG